MLDGVMKFLVSLPNVFLGASAGIVLSAVIKFGVDVKKQRTVNQAIADRDIGIQFANLVYTNHQRTKGENKYTQRLRTVASKLDLAKIFNGKAQERYLEYLSRANELARQSETNPYIPDYLEQAIENCHRGVWQSAVNSFAKIDAKEIRNNILRDFKIGVAEYIQDRVGSYPRLFDGVDFEKAAGTTLYPMLVGEKESGRQQMKIILMRENDLRQGVIADREEHVNVRISKGRYAVDREHRDMLRWRTNVGLKQKLNKSSVARDEIRMQIGLPIELQMATQGQRNKTGLLPPPRGHH